MKNIDGYWYSPWNVVPPNLPTGPHFPRREVEAARRRVVIKRAMRRALRAMELSGELTLTDEPWPPTFLR